MITTLTDMRRAIETAFGPSPDFFATFNGYGWYLDDLGLTRVNQMVGVERMTAWDPAKDRPCLCSLFVLFCNPL
ncbi:hypothetical protein AB8A20_05320 [Tardiphaga sp. 604_B6_N1_1]|uniref:hypothetical protein n=1 Tax=unclassified Tardiphaga TaxID=2631404 RepID=UPI003F27C27E